jgi:hypothetical protein
MKLGVMILPFSIWLLPGVAIAQTPVTAGPACITSNGVTTLNPQVLYLNSNAPFQPNSYYPDYNSPQADSSISISNSLMATDLNNAFNFAPAFFQQQLCHLDAVFINPAGCSNFNSSNVCTNSLTPLQTIENSWGFREQPNQFAPGATPSHYGRYIAMSAASWSALGTQAPKYSAFEQILLQQLLPWPAGNHPPTYSPATPNSSALTVLAALAHEFGHVFWYDNFRPTPGGVYDFNTFCQGKFFDDTWEQVDPPPIWRKFGEPQNSHKNYDMQISQLALAIDQGISSTDFTEANTQLRRIYIAEAHWPSLFGAFSPDEDFVETFKLYVLTNAATGPLTSLPLNFYDNNGVVIHTEDIPKDLQDSTKKLGLRRKITCFGP